MIEIDPNSSILIDYICTKHTGTLEHLNPSSACFKRLQNASQSTTPLLEDPISKDPEAVSLILMLILASMVFSDQSFESVCRSCRVEHDTLHIVWKNNIKSSVKAGMPHHQLKQFLTETKRHLYPGVKTPKLSDILIACQSQYKLNLHAFQETDTLIRETLAVLNTGTKKPSIEHLFLMICSAPNNYLTQIYTELSQLINDDDSVETTLQNTIKIRDIFQSSSPNIHLTFEKIKTHFNLCFYHTDPDYRRNLSTKTSDIVWPILNQSGIKFEIKKTLTETSTQLIHVYKQFFENLANYTAPLLKFPQT